MKTVTSLACVALGFALSSGEGIAWATEAAQLRVEPASVTLVYADARQQLLVTSVDNGRESDVTAEATFSSANPAIARVSPEGLVTPVSDGTTPVAERTIAERTAQIIVTVGERKATVDVTVRQAGVFAAPHFANDIIPLLTKAGCNSGACHGKQSGQNGFKLSVFGYDAASDYEAFVKEGRGRRLSPAAPKRSLILSKASQSVPHAGGMRFSEDSPQYRRLLRWIDAGMPFGESDAATVVAIELYPSNRVMKAGSRQRLLVTARFSDGSRRDVTHEAVYTSNDETIATVDTNGLITTTKLGGEAAIVARYQDQVGSCRVAVPINENLAAAAQLANWDQTHFVDRLAAHKWTQLQVVPSPPADDATFHRRAYLDLIGKLPTAAEARSFLSDNDSRKRARLIDALLVRSEYADYWTLFWSDLLRVNRDDLGPKAAHRYHAWIRRSLADNKPYDRFVREIITAQGSSERNGAVNFYRAFPDPNGLSISVSQVFLGVRLECARCHHHPYEKWGQEDFYGLAAFFPRIQKKAGDGTDLIYYVGDSGDVRHPRTQAVVSPQVLREPLKEPGSDPRQVLADWMCSSDNRFVARALVNRVCAQLMGRGLVEPVDDLRETNPATNEPLLAALARDFVEHKYDLKHLIRTITTSRLYGLSSQANESNARDTQNYSRAYRKRLGAEVLLDAVSDATADPEQFAGMPPGTRAVQLWDHRLPSPFLDIFGRPQRKTVCQCERQSEASIGQVLHLMNSSLINDKLNAPTGRVARLAASRLSDDEIVEELYLTCVGRMPKDSERRTALEAFSASGAIRRGVAEDILWALLNSAEFVLNH